MRSLSIRFTAITTLVFVSILPALAQRTSTAPPDVVSANRLDRRQLGTVGRQIP
jgi:hypothetical protein